MWLPHGLANGTEISDLTSLISICRFKNPNDTESDCVPLKYNLTRPALGKLRMTVPELQPRLRYKVAVNGSDKVKDAFGLALKVGLGSGDGGFVGFWRFSVVDPGSGNSAATASLSL